MSRSLSTRRIALAFSIVLLVALHAIRASGDELIAMKIRSATLQFEEDGVSLLRMSGTGPELGTFSAFAEIEFAPALDDDLFDGTGVVAFATANGDLLVGVIAAKLEVLDSDHGLLTSEIEWRDSVTFSDGSTRSSSGRFKHHRPPGEKPVGPIELR